MTIEQRLEQVEQQNQKIQRTNKRLTVALTLMAVVVCAVVTMAATNIRDISNSENGRYEFFEIDSIAGHAVLDNATGDLWRIDETTKTPVTLKR
jgi:hypothetical protein